MIAVSALRARRTGAFEASVVTLLTSALVILVLAAHGAVHGGRGAALVLLWATEVAFAIGALAWLLHLPQRPPDPAAVTSFAAALALVLAGVDTVHVRFFQSHIDRARLALAYEALRTSALPVPWDILASVAAVFLLLWGALFVLAKALTYVPRPAVTIDVRIAGPLLLAATVAFGVRDCGPGASVEPETVTLHASIPWDNGVAQCTGQCAPSLDPIANVHTIRLLEARRDDIAHAALSSRTRPDILIVHIESLRAEMVRPDTTPNLLRLASSSLTVPRFYAGGNNTPAGMFAILTGLPSAYYALARAAKLGPLPLQVLHQLGYKISASFVSDLGVYHGLFDTLFRGIVDDVYTKPEGEPSYVGDAHMVDRYLARLSAPGDGPRFDYLVFDSTHYHYEYPPELERFTPAQTIGANVFTVDKDSVAPLRNRYRNSILYVDSLLGRLFDRLRESGHLDGTVVVVVGDHGEEFFETGEFGHGTSLHELQTQVPLFLRIPSGILPPERAHVAYVIASHADLFPTLFDAMGLSWSGEPFMAGKSLLRYDPALDIALLGHVDRDERTNDLAMTEGKALKVLWHDGQPLSVEEVRDLHDALITTYDQDVVSDLVLRGLALKTLRSPARGSQ